LPVEKLKLDFFGTLARFIAAIREKLKPELFREPWPD
jgi:hypothetical protein